MISRGIGILKAGGLLALAQASGAVQAILIVYFENLTEEMNC